MIGIYTQEPLGDPDLAVPWIMYFKSYRVIQYGEGLIVSALHRNKELAVIVLYILLCGIIHRYDDPLTFHPLLVDVKGETFRRDSLPDGIGMLTRSVILYLIKDDRSVIAVSVAHELYMSVRYHLGAVLSHLESEELHLLFDFIGRMYQCAVHVLKQLDCLKSECALLLHMVPEVSISLYGRILTEQPVEPALLVIR